MAAKDIHSAPTDGYRDGWEGYGRYRNGRRVDSGRAGHALRRLPRRLAVSVTIAALVAAAYFIAMHWHAIVTAVFTVASLVVMSVCLWFGRSSINLEDDEDENDIFGEGDGYRYGTDGYGYYIQGIRYRGPIGDD